MHKKLTRDQQINLCNKMHSGNKQAREDLIDSCLPLVINIANKFRYNNKHIDLEDMIQEGNIALMKAVDNWNVDKGSITTVATWYIRNTLIDMITDARYNIKYPYDMSRRAAEQLRKIKNLNSNNVEYLAKKTGLSKKRIKKLLSISPSGTYRLKFSLRNKNKFEENLVQNPIVEEETQVKPCIGDLVHLMNTSLNTEQKTIFCLWAGISRKKIGPKEIAQSLDVTEQYVYDTIYASKRILSRAAKAI